MKIINICYLPIQEKGGIHEYPNGYNIGTTVIGFKVKYSMPIWWHRVIIIFVSALCLHYRHLNEKKEKNYASC